MQQESVWLGPMRQPVRVAAIAATAAAVLTCGWLIVNRLFLGSEIGMHQMLRPGDLISVKLALWSLFAALLLGSVYLSDIRGAIEIEAEGFFDWISLVLSRLAMISTVLIVLVMFYEVVARYVFEKPTLWANELSLWMAAFLFLLAGLYAMQQRSHIRIYVIYDMMPRWAQKLSDCISVFLIWVFAFCVIWGGYSEALTKLMRWEAFGTAWDPPLPGTLKPAIVLLVVLVALQALSNLIADWNKAPEHHSPADDIDQTEIENIRRTLEIPKNG
ncbi:TRAP transporter small permease subunit [Szabonella alba]|uniref:TRAP transporter small permease protein n=1 Tax=Szabonella alba TaxID=2804194 RepID=A0A8K0V9E4_9RHOB|nr:TRAP transporter small permease [Szabonella alba]MBL4915689.1 TRAP transporter small permease [Szabonella alba]